MQMTLEQIADHENRLLAQIAQSQQILANYQRVRADREQALLAPAPVPAPGEPGEVEKRLRRSDPSCHLGDPPDDRRLQRARRRRRAVPGGVPAASAHSWNGVEPAERRALKDERKLVEVSKGRGRTPSIYGATAEVMTGPLALAARHRASRRDLLIRAAL